MTAENDAKPATGTELRIPCQRVPKRFTVEQHLGCCYCCGDQKEVARGDYERFCEYWRAFDAIRMGFPEDFGRYAWR